MLWDESDSCFRTSREDMAALVRESVQQRQGADTGNPERGRRFLDAWSCSLADCRSTLSLAEMVQIILGTPLHKSPGPNGVPAVAYKNFVKFVAPIFIEAMDELQQPHAEVPIGLGERIGKIIPKLEGAAYLHQIRDLELPNEHRKILARAFSLILDEQVGERMCGIQQAFISGL